MIAFSFETNVADPAAAAAEAVFSDRLTKRGAAKKDGFKITFQHGDAMKICRNASGCVLYAPDTISYLNLAGELLRLICAGQKVPENFLLIPKMSIRGIYMASHFHNFYITASAEEVRRYIEDLALWGFNCLEASFPSIDIESESSPEWEDAASRLDVLFQCAKGIGMKICISSFTNNGYKECPREYEFTPVDDPLGRHGNSGNMMCISKPGAQVLIDGYNRRFFERMRANEPDMVIAWPYDEGGCGCKDCAPWGANGFIRSSKRMFQVARSCFPNITRVVSTWTFDTPVCGEWEALTNSLREEKWCDVIEADAHEDYPRYPLEHGVPGGLPLINFPEISMWGLYPWGGWGAAALPERFTRLASQCIEKLDGGFVYSEGIFEDINKVVISQIYLKGQLDWKKTVADYAATELGLLGEDADKLIEIVSLLEKTHTSAELTHRCDLKDVVRASSLAFELEKKVPAWAEAGFRWRQIVLRTVLDERRYSLTGGINPPQGWEKVLKDDAPSRKAFRELCLIYHSLDHMEEDLYHCRVRPIL